MKTKIYYLNWENETNIGRKVIDRSMFGFKSGDKPCLELYRLHEYDLQSIVLEDIWVELNADDRFNGQEERSLSVGDIIELNGVLYGVDNVGFYRFVDEDTKAKLEIAEKIGNLCKQLTEISLLWEYIKDTDFLDTNYPFDKSFDELVSDVKNWSESVNKQIGLD